MKEMERAKERRRAAEENRALEQRRAADRDREEFAKAQRGAARARQRRRDELRAAVTGPESLFSAAVQIFRVIREGQGEVVDDRPQRIAAASSVQVPGMA